MKVYRFPAVASLIVEARSGALLSAPQALVDISADEIASAED